MTADFEDQLQRTLTEPISGLLAAVADRGEDLHASLRFSLEPCSARQRRPCSTCLRRLPPGRSIVGYLLSSDEFAMRANGSLLERLAVRPFSFFGGGEVPDDTIRKLNDHLFRVTIELRVVAPLAGRVTWHRSGSLLLPPPFRLLKLQDALLGESFGNRSVPCCRLLNLLRSGIPPVAETHTDSMQAAGLPHLPPPVELVDCSKEEGVLPLGKTVVGVPKLVGSAW